ncbi:MAG: hypothetical protein JSS34_06560 [Proteobacteria bacterium]|nr:hypothetical protein [Pseudomonadota bacterium]
MNSFFYYGLPSFFEKVFSEASFPVSSDIFEKISLRYQSEASREGASLSFKKEEAFVYALGRMPATIAAIKDVLRRLRQQNSKFSPNSFLDIGSGPGSFLWAFLEYFPKFERGVLWEGNASFLDFLKLFLKEGETSFKSLQNVEVLEKNIINLSLTENEEYFDLVNLSYVLSEISEKEQPNLLEKAWKKTRDVLMIIEPGTPNGFLNILRARHFFKEQGGFFCAPCPHQNRCPLENTKDWCHFSVRLKRSHLHKRLKSASLSYEDEKYAYLIVQKKPVERNSLESRILKNPLKRTGHIIFDGCSQKGEERITISKKTPRLYKEAKAKEWGDLWENEEE